MYTPESGFNLPGVAFGHDWLTDVGHYHRTLEHLASWGIVAAAPDTERGVAPSVLNLAYDLGTTLDIVAGVRLGPGQISVHPTKLAVAGHGFGGAAAVFAAAGLAGPVRVAPEGGGGVVSRGQAAVPAAGGRPEDSGLVLAAPTTPNPCAPMPSNWHRPGTARC